MRIDLLQCKSTSFQTLCTSNACSTEFIMNAVKQQNYFWHSYHSLVLVFLWCLYLLLWSYLGIGIPLTFISPFMVISLYIAVGYLLLWSCLFFIFPFMAISPVWSSLVHNSCRSSLCKKTRLRQVFSEGESVLSHVHTQWKHTSPDIAHVNSRRLTKQAHKHIPPPVTERSADTVHEQLPILLVDLFPFMVYELSAEVVVFMLEFWLPSQLLSYSSVMHV